MACNKFERHLILISNSEIVLTKPSTPLYKQHHRPTQKFYVHYVLKVAMKSWNRIKTNN